MNCLRSKVLLATPSGRISPRLPPTSQDGEYQEVPIFPGEDSTRSFDLH